MLKNSILYLVGKRKSELPTPQWLFFILYLGISPIKLPEYLQAVGLIMPFYIPLSSVLNLMLRKREDINLTFCLAYLMDVFVLVSLSFMPPV